MARITVRVPADEAWDPGARLRVYVGSENAASLDSSDPPGGTAVHEQPAWPHRAEQGGFGAPGTEFGKPGSNVEDFTIVCGFGHPGSRFGEFGFGRGCVPPRVLSVQFRPRDISAVLPVGVCLVNSDGQESEVYETLVQLADPPRSVSHLRAEQREPQMVTLRWEASPDI